MSLPPGAVGMIVKCLAVAAKAPPALMRAAGFASLTVVEVLLEALGSGAVEDVRRYKDAMVADREAETELKKASAAKAMAEAVEAANKATLPKRQDAFKRAELRKKEAEAAKTEAEAAAIRQRAKTERISAVADAKARLLEALGRLRGEGGQIMVDPEELERLTRIEPAPAKNLPPSKP